MGKTKKIEAAYRVIARIYDNIRPLWAKLVMGRAETHLEQMIFPRILSSKFKILDLGTGTGINLDRLRRLGLPYARFTGLDLTPSMLQQAQAKLDKQDNGAYSRGDMRHLPFVDKSFDLVISTWALSHMAQPQDVLAEASRVLKSDGVLIFLFWTLPSFPFNFVAKLFAPLFLVQFVDLGEFQQGLGEQAEIHRFAGGWGTSIVIPSSI